MVAETSTQELILAIVPKIGASISIPCSLFIISECISDHRQRNRGTAIQRALMGMSCVDVLASTAWWLSNWAVPASTGALGRGNVASCNFQGFLLQLAIGAPLYNCSLSLFYLLVIRYNWTNEQLVKIERFVHGSILTFAIGTSIAGLPLTMYNRVGTVCWVVGSPPDCGNSITTPNELLPCDRGDWAWTFGVFLFYFPLWVCVLLTVGAMSMIYAHVRATFGRLRQYGFEDESSDGWALTGRRQRQRQERNSAILSASARSQQQQQQQQQAAPVGTASRRPNTNRLPNSIVREARRATKLAVFATQASLYSASFFITWTPSTVWSIAHWFNVGSFWLDFASALCEPLQGVWNLMVFLRRREESREKIRNALGCFSCFFLILHQAQETVITKLSIIRRPSTVSQNFTTSNNNNNTNNNNNFASEVAEPPSRALGLEQSAALGLDQSGAISVLEQSGISSSAILSSSDDAYADI